MTSTQQKVIRNKVGLLRLAEELGNVSRACQVMGYSRDTFYRYKQAAEEGGFEALVEQSRKTLLASRELERLFEDAKILRPRTDPQTPRIRRRAGRHALRAGLGSLLRDVFVHG